MLAILSISSIVGFALIYLLARNVQRDLQSLTDIGPESPVIHFEPGPGNARRGNAAP